ncbi:MAG: DNA-binding response regulator [Acidimicrobiales bacterium]|nr:DNA-binding response regulator [Acidimicrobiales bacterium]
MTRTRGPIGADPSGGRRYGSLSSRLDPDETIVVVEDEKDIATFLRAYFRASGQEVVHVDPTSTEEVSAAVDTHQPICVLLDLNLRGLHGLDVFREIRRHGAEIPVIVVTADQNPATKKAVLREGVTAFVQKPFKVKDLCDLVAHHTGKGATGEAGGSGEIETRLAKEVAGANRAKPVSFALVRLVAGDVPMGDVARSITDALPSAAFVARSEGSELGVILPATTAMSAEKALTTALGDVAAPAVVRAGVAACPEHAATLDELYMAADAALAGSCDTGDLVTLAV